MRVSLNTLQQQHDCLLDLPEWDDWGDDRPTREEMVERYTVAALKALRSECDAGELTSFTQEDVEAWALEIAAENGEEWKD